MADQPTFQSPVTSPGVTSGPLRLTDETASARVLVRGADSGLSVRFGSSDRRHDGVLVCGTRPDEWILLGPLLAVDDIIRSVPVHEFVSVVDQTHGRAMFRLTGGAAAEALAKVCSLDLGDHMTPDGAVVSASVAKVICDLVRDDVDGTRSYLVICDRSFGAYLFDALADAMAEFASR